MVNISRPKKKSRVSITINPLLSEIISKKSNVSKYVEWLIYQDLKKNNEINEMSL